MRKYAFRQGDIVRENTAEKNPVVGRVIGCGSSAGHDYYKVESGEDIWNARDDELVLIRRRRFDPRSNPPFAEDEIERDLLIWKPMSVDPPKGAECLAVWRRTDGALREHVLRWDGERWIMEYDGDKMEFDREFVDAWTLWDWPEIPEIGPDADIDQKSNGEEGVRDDADDDQDDGQGRD